MSQTMGNIVNRPILAVPVRLAAVAAFATLPDRPGVINRGANLFSRPIHCACIASSLHAHALPRLSVGYERMRAAEFRKIRTLEPKFYLSVMHARETDEIVQKMHACCLLCLADQLIRCARSARHDNRQTNAAEHAHDFKSVSYPC